MTVPLSHLINVLHSVKSSVGCNSSSAAYPSRKQKKLPSDSGLAHTEVYSSLIQQNFFRQPFEVYVIGILCSVQPKVSLRELGLSDLGVQQLKDLVNHVLPCWGPQDVPFPLGGQTVWKTSHMSTHSFFCNKHGETDLIL